MRPSRDRELTFEPGVLPEDRVSPLPRRTIQIVAILAALLSACFTYLVPFLKLPQVDLSSSASSGRSHDEEPVYKGPKDPPSALDSFDLKNRESRPHLEMALRLRDSKDPTDQEVSLACVDRVLQNEAPTASDHLLAQLRALRGDLLLRRGECEQAIVDLEAASKLDPSPETSILLLRAYKAEDHRLRTPPPWPEDRQRRLQEIGDRIEALEKKLEGRDLQGRSARLFLGVEKPSSLSSDEASFTTDGAPAACGEALEACSHSVAAAVFDAAAAFTLKCSGCHSVGQGDVVGPDLKDVTERRETRWLHAFIRSSRNVVRAGDPAAAALFHKYQKRMPDQEFSDQEIDALLGFISSGGPKPAAGDHSAGFSASAEETAAERDAMNPGVRRALLELLRASASLAAAHDTAGHDDRSSADQVLAVGVNGTGERFGPLRHAAEDAERVSTALGGLALRPKVLVNAAATRPQILAELSRVALASRPGDTFIFYFSGHGFTDIGGHPVLVTAGGPSDTLSLEEINSVLSAHRGRAIVLLDSCFSDAQVATGTRALPLRGANPPTFILAGVPGGRVIESPRLGSGLFTYTLLRYLAQRPSGPELDFGAMYHYAASETSRLARALYGEDQRPQWLSLR